MNRLKNLVLKLPFFWESFNLRSRRYSKTDPDWDNVVTESTFYRHQIYTSFSKIRRRYYRVDPDTGKKLYLLHDETCIFFDSAGDYTIRYGNKGAPFPPGEILDMKDALASMGIQFKNGSLSIQSGGSNIEIG